jgi:hypothetical protein
MVRSTFFKRLCRRIAKACRLLGLSKSSDPAFPKAQFSMSETQPFSVDPALFTRRVNFAGVLNDGGYSSQPLSIEIAYSLVNEHMPFGLIRGGHAEFVSLQAPMMAYRGHFSRLDSTSPFGWTKITCNDVRMRALESGPAERSHQSVIRTIADFEFYELTLQRDIGGTSSGFRTIVFFLIGPGWPSQPTRILETDQLGNVKVEELDPERPIIGIDDVTASIHTQYINAETQRADTLPSQRRSRKTALPHREFRVGADVCTIKITDKLKDRACDDFVRRAIELVDGMALAASFLSKASLTWYSYQLVDGSKLTAFYRRQPNEPDDGSRWDELVVNPANAKTFISTAASALVGKRLPRVDIKTIIVLYLTAQKVPYLSEKFAVCYRALENCVSQLRELNPPKRLLSKEDISEMRTVVVTLLKERRLDEESIRIVSQKLGNLGQPDFLKQLQATMAANDVTYDDLGGTEALKLIYRTRNRIFHSHNSSFDELVIATAKLETLLERIIISLLGWRGSITSPTYTNRMMLGDR